MPKVASAKTKESKSKIETKTIPEVSVKPVNPKVELNQIVSRLISLKPKSYTPILVVLLIVAAFLLGVLLTKVYYLENGTPSNYALDDQNIGENTGPVPGQKVDVKEGHLPPLGNKDAKVKIVEFSDFQCPFCKALFDNSLSQIKKDYIDTGKISFYFRQFPLTAIHPNAQKAAEASECANEQGKFWEFHDVLFNKQAEWEALSNDAAVAKFSEYAYQIGINGATLSECTISGKMATKVDEDLNDGSSVGVTGTPTMYINGLPIVGAEPYESIKAAIEKALSE